MSLGRKFTFCSLSIAVVLFVGVGAFGQQNDYPPKVDVFAGYQWLNPGGIVPDPATGQRFNLPSMAKGWGTAVTYNFSKNWGLSADFGGNYKNNVGNEHTLSVGPRFMWRTEGLNLFAHTLLSLNLLSITGDNETRKGIGAVLGGGFDLPITRRFSWRVLEADYVWARHNFADVVPSSDPHLRRPEFGGARLRSGLVFNFGGEPPVPPAASCSAQPTEVLAGEPITVNVTPSNFNPKHTVTYSYTATGGKVTPKDAAATVDTTGMSPGSYTVTAKAADPKMKKNGEASCNASFTIKQPPKPPVMNCSANPASVQIGNPATVTCECTSPDGVSVTVAGWNASSGKLSGSGSTATLDTTGASAGSSSISATCTDSRGLTASGSTSVGLETPPPPKPVVDKVLEAKLALHSVYFPTDLPKANKPEGGLVASQQQTLTDLAADFKKYREAVPDAHLTLEGHADVRGSVPYNQALSERRVARVKSFLVEQGVPESALDTKALGKEHNMTQAEVKASVDDNPDLTPGERKRILRNMRTIILASNRRVDITLNAPGQTETSVRRYPFNAADSLTLIGGREKIKEPAAKPATKKPAKKKK